MRNIWLNQVRHAHSGPQFVDIDGEQEQNAVTHAKSSDDLHALDGDVAPGQTGQVTYEAVRRGTGRVRGTSARLRGLPGGR
ncbi:MAG: hypothetical protein ABSG56_00115 [Bryobacteraceae bacterium]